MSRTPFAGLRCARNWALKFPAPTPQLQQRTFSSSPLLLINGPVPKFKPASTPELQALVDDIRLNYIMPRHLSQIQKNLVLSPTKKGELEKEEVIASIHGEDFRLRHIPQTAHYRSVHRLIVPVVKAMHKKDFDILPDFTKSLFAVKREQIDSEDSTAPWLSSTRAWIIRRAMMHKRQDVILECLRCASDSGFTLEPDAKARAGPTTALQEVMMAMHSKALDAKFNAPGTKKALSWAEMVVDMIQDPKYKVDPEYEADRYRYTVIGPLLDLAAIRASKHLHGKDEDGKVAKYLHEFMSLPWEIKPSEGAIASFWLAEKSVLLHGMKTTETLLDSASEDVQGLRTRIADLEEKVLDVAKSQEKVIADIVATLPADAKMAPRRGLTVYNSLFGTQKPSEEA